MGEKWVCWYCGTKSEGNTCPVCDANLDAQREEMAALNAAEESTGLLDMSQPTPPPAPLPQGRDAARIQGGEQESAGGA